MLQQYLSIIKSAILVWLEFCKLLVQNVLHAIWVMVSTFAGILSTYVLSPIYQGITSIASLLYTYMILPIYKASSFVVLTLLDVIGKTSSLVFHWVLVPLYNALAYCAVKLFYFFKYIGIDFVLVPIYKALSFMFTNLYHFVASALKYLRTALPDWAILPIYDALSFVLTNLYHFVASALKYLGTALLDWVITPVFQCMEYLGEPFVRWLWEPLLQDLQIIWGEICVVVEFFAQMITWRNFVDLLLVMIGVIFNPVIGLHFALITPALTRVFFSTAILAATFILPMSYWKIKQYNRKVTDPKKQFRHAVKTSAAAAYSIFSFATLSNYKQISQILFRM